jgi:hypothetical protein
VGLLGAKAIRPSKIPQGEGVALSFLRIHGAKVAGHPHERVGAARFDYLKLSKQCTGS